MVATAILFEPYLDRPSTVLGVRYHSAKFGYDQCSSFDKVNFSVLGALAGKRLFMSPKLGFWGSLIPEMGCNINQSQKGTPLCKCASFEPSSMKMW